MRNMARYSVAVLLMLFLVCVVHASYATDAMPAQWRDDVARAEAYLNGLTTVVAEFEQISPDGMPATGTFFLKRPGKFRWQYNPPVPLLIVSDGTILAYQDLELDQISHLPAESNLTGILARPSLDFHDPDITVSAVEKAEGALRITLHQTGKADEGRVTLVFDEDPFALSALQVVDATGQRTQIALSNLRYGMELKNRLFYVDYTKRQRKRN